MTSRQIFIRIFRLIFLCSYYLYWQDGDCYCYNYFATALTDTVLITGSTDGIGVTTARNILYKHNVLIHGRDEDRIRIAADSLRNNNNNNNNSSNNIRSMKKGSVTSTATTTTTTEKNLVVPLPAADLSTIKGCYDLAREVKECCNSSTGDGMNLKILVNNAGIYSNRLIRTPDGLESTFAVNVLAPFILSSMLLSTLLANGSNDKNSSNNNNNNNRSRIVIASSVSQSWKLPKDYWDDPQYVQRLYSAHGAYSESKLLVAMLTMEMAHRLDKLTSIVTCNCLDPGTVNTKMLIDGWGPIGIGVNDALDESWCCQSSELEGISGQYFVSRTSRKASSDAYDTIQRDKLWRTLSELAPKAAAEWDRAVSMYSSEA